MTLDVGEAARERLGVYREQNLLPFLIAHQAAERFHVEGDEHAPLLALPIRAYDVEHEISLLLFVDSTLDFKARHGHHEGWRHTLAGELRLYAHFVHTISFHRGDANWTMNWAAIFPPCASQCNGAWVRRGQEPWAPSRSAGPGGTHISSRRPMTSVAR